MQFFCRKFWYDRIMSLKNSVQNIVFKLYIVFAVYAVALVAVLGFSIYNKIAPNALTTTPYILHIPQGTPSFSVAAKIAKLVHANPFVIYSAIKITDKKIKSGEFIITADMNALQILHMIDSYQVKHRKITIPNGAWYGDMDRILKNTPYLTNKTPIPRNRVIWAETYFYERGENSQQIITRMQEQYLAKAEQMWQKRDKSLPLNNLDDAFILASMVERESSIPAEQPIIAGVFINRLRKNMRLQSDPTVIYAVTNSMGDLDRPLRSSDLKFDSPYNTYVSDGLPPTPISSIELTALKSVLQPATHQYYYFVASPDGGHNFAKNLRQHNKNVSLYRKSLK